MEFICSSDKATSTDGRLSLIYHRMEAGNNPYEGLFDFKVVIDGQTDGYGLRFVDKDIDGMSSLVVLFRTTQDVSYFLAIRDALSPAENDFSFLKSVAQAIVNMLSSDQVMFDTRFIAAISKALLAKHDVSLPQIDDPFIPESYVLAAQHVKATNFSELPHD